MGKVCKIILVSAEHHPYHKKWLELAKNVAEQLGVELEVKIEDYVFAIEHGHTDDLGMAGLPQLFAETNDGDIKLLLYEIPLNKAFQPDFEKAKEVVISKIKEIEES